MAYMKDSTGKRLDTFAVAPKRFPATADAFNAPARVSPGLIAIGVTTSDPGTFLVQSGTILRWSPNFGTNLNNATIPTNTGEFQFVYEWNGYVYLIAKDWGDNLYKVYRAISPTVADPTLEWSAALMTLTAGANASAPSITATANALVICEQGDPLVGGVKTANIWRTTNGTTFTAVKTLSSAYRHFHCVAADPYNPGHIWATSGDNVNNCFHKSTDHGATWTDIAIPMAWQTVQISFTADLIYLAPDAVGIAPLYVMDRNTLAIKVGSYDSHRNVRVMEPGAYSSGNPNTSTTYGTTEPVFVSTDVGRRITGTHIPAGTTIATFSNSKQVTLSAATVGTTTNAVFTIERPERPRSVAFLGAVDPATGIYYGVTNNDLGGSTGVYGRPIMFMVPFPGGPVITLGDLVDAASPAVFINQGRVWFGSYCRPLITLA